MVKPAQTPHVERRVKLKSGARVSGGGHKDARLVVQVDVGFFLG